MNYSNYGKGLGMIEDSKKILYVVSTYYHALICCIKQLNCRKNADILVTAYIPDGENLAARIKNSGLFESVSYVGEVQQYEAKNKLDYLFNYHKKNAELIESQIDFDFGVYDEVNIFHDDTWMAHYLKDRRISYRLIEDALNSFKVISRTCFAYMLPRRRFWSLFKRTFGIGYVFCGYDKCTTEVEINELDGLEIADFAKDKLVEAPRKPMFDALTEADKKVLCDVFMKDIPPIEPEKSVLLLTQPLYIDGTVSSEEEQIEIYKRLVAENITDEKLVIKPHPRDLTDYSAAFPEAVILDKNMPVEVMDLLLSISFKISLVSEFSSVVKLKCVENIVVFNGDFINYVCNGLNP